MAELPGWDRGRLRSADPADVEAARWRVFASAVAPIATFDVEGELEKLKLADLQPKARERAEKTARSKDRERLTKALRERTSVRRLLLVDERPPGG